MVIDPFGNGTDAFCPENIKGGVSGLTVDASGRGEAEVVACVDGIAVVVEQLDDEAGPLARGDGNGAIGLSDVADGCLGTTREVVDGETNGGKSAPGARERIRVNGAVDGGGGGCWGTRERKIMYSPILTGFAWLGDPREWGGLKGADEQLDLPTSARANVTALGELVIDHVRIGLGVLEQGGAIRGGESKINGPYAGVETFEQRRDEIGVFDK